VPREIADLAMEAFVRQREAEGNAGLVDHALPAIYAGLDFFDVVIAQAFVERGQRGDSVRRRPLCKGASRSGRNGDQETDHSAGR